MGEGNQQPLPGPRAFSVIVKTDCVTDGSFTALPRNIVTRGETGQGQEAQRHDTRHGPGSRGTRVLMTRAVTGAVRTCLAPVSSRSHTLYGGTFHLIILKHGSLSN